MASPGRSRACCGVAIGRHTTKIVGPSPSPIPLPHPWCVRRDPLGGQMTSSPAHDVPPGTQIDIPYTTWQPLSVTDVVQLFAGAPFTWGLGGGYCIEQFLGRTIRAHDDIDVVVFRDEQLLLQHWLAGWHLYAADPPGTLRPWAAEE